MINERDKLISSLTYSELIKSKWHKYFFIFISFFRVGSYM
jgi:hypothetical protein